MKNNFLNKTNKIIIGLSLLASLISQNAIVYASDITSEQVIGNAFVFSGDLAEKSAYAFDEASECIATDQCVTLGKLTINGDIADITDIDGIPAYKINGNELEFLYDCNDSMLEEDGEDWKIYKDDSKQIDVLELDSKIKRGAIIVQVSDNGIDWYTDVIMTDVFDDASAESDVFYAPTDEYLANGCFYHVIVVYGMRRKTGDKKLLLLNDYEYEKRAEVYTFYAINPDLEYSLTELESETETEKKGRFGSFIDKVKDKTGDIIENADDIKEHAEDIKNAIADKAEPYIEKLDPYKDVIADVGSELIGRAGEKVGGAIGGAAGEVVGEKVGSSGGKFIGKHGSKAITKGIISMATISISKLPGGKYLQGIAKDVGGWAVGEVGGWALGGIGGFVGKHVGEKVGENLGEEYGGQYAKEYSREYILHLFD